MKIVENTPERLVLRHRPIVAPAFSWILAASQVGVMLTKHAELSALNWVVVVGLTLGCACAGVVSAVGTTFRFDAADGALHWARSNPFRYRRAAGRVPLSAIRRVGVEELRPGADTGPSWRLVVSTRSGPLPLTLGFSNFGNHEAVAETVRTWLSLR